MSALRILNGAPSDDEIAALAVVLLSRSVPVAELGPAVRQRGGWADPAAALGQSRPGPGAWRASAR